MIVRSVPMEYNLKPDILGEMINNYRRFVNEYCQVDEEKAKYLGALGLAGESGEVVDILKKHLIHGKTLDKTELTDELGDTFWHLVLLMNLYNISFAELICDNQAKLRKRHSHKEYYANR